MKKAFHYSLFPQPKFSVFILMILLAGGCSYLQWKLDGEVFIVTKGGENVRLGLVTVQAISEDKMKEFIVKKSSESKTEIEKLQKEIKKAEIELADAEKEAKSSEKERDRRSTILRNSLASRKANNYHKDAVKIHESKLNILFDKRKNLDVLKSKQYYYGSAAFYFNGLPDPVTSAKTDADGRFTLFISRERRVALAAHASRQVSNKKEEYYWLVWVSLDEKPPGNIFLSNDNMTDVGAKDSVITTNKY
jgi:hypothetical protein